jgi:glycosyltransferase involved in cell wall biosynthesis
MKVLMLSIDESILREGSDAGKRMALYGRAAEELHIIVYTKEKKDAFQIAENVYAYPATARFKVLYFLGFYTIAARLLGAGGDWLITSQDAFTHIIGIFLKKKFSVPLEIQIHTDFLSPYFRFESVKNYIRFHLYAYAAKRADSIRVVSERIRKLIEAVKGVQVPVFVLPALIDTEEIKKISVTADLHKKYPQFDFIVLMASRLTKEKDIGLALRAFSVLAKKYRKLGLLIVGDGPEQSALLARTLRLRLDSNVIFERAVPFSDLISYYKTADLFLLTSLYEGYGR